MNERHIDVEGIFLSILTYKRSLWQFMRHLRSSSGLLYCPLPPLAPSSCLGLWVSPQHCPFKSAQMPPSEGSFPAKHTLAGHTPPASPRWVSFSIALTSTSPVVCLSVCWLSASYRSLCVPENMDLVCLSHCCVPWPWSSTWPTVNARYRFAGWKILHLEISAFFYCDKNIHNINLPF